MKVGILTFHTAHNYGAVLQAFALQETVKHLGAEAYIIDYRPKYITNEFKLLNWRKIIRKHPYYLLKNILYTILSFFNRYIRYKRFNDFIRNKLNLFPVDNENVFSYFDIYIIGSDQVWNKKLTYGYDDLFWGNFTTNTKAIKIAYAASFGFWNIKEELPFISNKLSQNFHSISIREKQDAELIQNRLSQKIYETIDPTLLLDSIFWKKIAIKPKLKRKYVLIYQLWPLPEVKKMAAQIASQIDAEIIEIGSSLSREFDDIGNIKYSPEEFLGLLASASCVITTSFHGTVFASIFNTPFYTLNLQDGSENRAKNFLKDIDLIDRLIYPNSAIEFSTPNFEKSNAILKELRSTSIDYLKKFIH